MTDSVTLCDGARPHVATVSTAIASGYYPLPPAARLVAYMLACDDFGNGAAPGRDNLQQWSGLPGTTVGDALCTIASPPDLLQRYAGPKGVHGPLIDRRHVKGKKRATYPFQDLHRDVLDAGQAHCLEVSGPRPLVSRFVRCRAVKAEAVTVRLLALVLALASTDGTTVTARMADLAAWTGLDPKTLRAGLSRLEALRIAVPSRQVRGYSAHTLDTYRNALHRLLADLECDGIPVTPETVTAWAQAPERPRNHAAPARKFADYLADSPECEPAEAVSDFPDRLPLLAREHAGGQASTWRVRFDAIPLAPATHGTGGKHRPEHRAEQGENTAQNIGQNIGQNRGENRGKTPPRTGGKHRYLPNTLPFPTLPDWPHDELLPEVSARLRGPLSQDLRRQRLCEAGKHCQDWADWLARWALVYVARTRGTWEIGRTWACNALLSLPGDVTDADALAVALADALAAGLPEGGSE